MTATAAKRADVWLPAPKKLGETYVIEAATTTLVRDGLGCAPFLLRPGETWTFLALVDAAFARATRGSGLVLGPDSVLMWVPVSTWRPQRVRHPESQRVKWPKPGHQAGWTVRGM